MLMYVCSSSTGQLKVSCWDRKNKVARSVAQFLKTSLDLETTARDSEQEKRRARDEVEAACFSSSAFLNYFTLKRVMNFKVW